MAGHVYTKRLLTALGMTTAAAGTVPLGKVWVLRDVEAVITSVPATNSSIFLSVAGAVFFARRIETGTSYQNLQWTGSVALGAGELLQAAAGGGTWNVMMTGYELDA